MLKNTGVEKIKRKEENESNDKNDEINTGKDSKKKILDISYYRKASTIKFNIDTKNAEEDTQIGKQIIDKFKKFIKSSSLSGKSVPNKSFNK